MTKRQEFLKHMIRELLIQYNKHYGDHTQAGLDTIDAFLIDPKTNFLQFLEVIDGEDFRALTTLIDQISNKETPDGTEEENWPLN